MIRVDDSWVVGATVRATADLPLVNDPLETLSGSLQVLRPYAGLATALPLA